MEKVLFLIHDLGGGGAEKVLVNLVSRMDRTRYDVTVIALFAGGINEQFLPQNDSRQQNMDEADVSKAAASSYYS